MATFLFLPYLTALLPVVFEYLLLSSLRPYFGPYVSFPDSVHCPLHGVFLASRPLECRPMSGVVPSIRVSLPVFPQEHASPS